MGRRQECRDHSADEGRNDAAIAEVVEGPESGKSRSAEPTVVTRN